MLDTPTTPVPATLEEIESHFHSLQAQLEEALNGTYPLSIYSGGKLIRERWDTLYHQILQRPQEYLTIGTHAEHLLSEFHMSLFQYYRYLDFVPVPIVSRAESTRRELLSHYWFAKAYTWACLLYHRGEYQAWTILEMIDTMLPDESLTLTLSVALALTEDAEGEVVVPASIEYKLSRIAPFYSMTPGDNGGYIKVLVPRTEQPLHTGVTDPHTPTLVVSESLYEMTAEQLLDASLDVPEIADIILDIVVVPEETETTETRLPVMSNV